MRLVDASSFIDPSAENLQSPGLAEQAQLPPYVVSPSPTRWLFNHGGLTWNPVTEMGTAENAAAMEMREEGETSSVVHHLQIDSDNHSVNTEYDLLFDMAGGMIMSPPRPGMNFSGEEALLLSPNFHADMAAGMMMSTSPPRMNCFSPSSGDSIGNSHPLLWNFAEDHSEAQELENRKGLVQQSCRGTHPQPQTNDDHSVNNIDEWFHMPTQLMPTMMNYSLPSDDHPLPQGLGGSFDLYKLWDDVDYRAVHELYKRERIVKTTLSLILVKSVHRPSEVLLNIAVQTMEKGLLVAHTDTQFKLNTPTFSLTEVEAGNEQPIIGRLIMASGELPHRNSLERQLIDNLERHAAESEKSVNLDRLAVELKTSVIVERIVAEVIKYIKWFAAEWFAAKRKKSDSFSPLLDARCRRLDSPCATNEETNNVVVVELNNSIDDAKGGNRSSYKIHTISRWEKDHGITRQVVHKSRDDIAETLKVSISTFKRACRSLEEVGTASEENHTAHIWHAAAGRGGMLLQQEDSSSEPHIPESSPTNEERNNVVVVELNNSIDAKGGNSSSEKTHTISRWEKDHGITRQVLQQLFGKSRDDAAKTLKVSTSTFKRACRNFGINRWPNHKGKMPNCSLNQKQDVQAVKRHKGIQPCPALPPEEATTTTLQGNSAISVKATYEDNTIRFPLPSSSTIKYLEEQLETRFKISLENFSILYQDEEADWISLTCDSDLMYGMDVLRSSGKTVVKMKINPNFG